MNRARCSQGLGRRGRDVLPELQDVHLGRAGAVCFLHQLSHLPSDNQRPSAQEVKGPPECKHGSRLALDFGLPKVHKRRIGTQKFPGLGFERLAHEALPWITQLASWIHVEEVPPMAH